MDPVRVSLYGLYPTTRWRYLGRQFVLFFTVLGMFLISLATVTPEQLAKLTAEGSPQPQRFRPSPAPSLLVASSVGLAAPSGTGPFLAAARIIHLRPAVELAPLTSDEMRDARSGVSRPEATSAAPYAGAVTLFVFVRWISGIALVGIVIETAVMLFLFARKTAERAGTQSSSQP